MRRLSLFVLLVALPAAGQDAPRASRITTGVVDSLRFRMIQGKDTVDAGWGTDEIRLAERDGRKVVERTYRTASPLLGHSTATMIDGHETLRPILYRNVKGTQERSVEFTPGTAKVVSKRPSGVLAETSHSIPRGAISASSYDLWLRTGELGASMVLEIGAFMAEPERYEPFHATVAAEERIGGVDCWRVDTRFAGLPVSFWIGKSDRRMVRQKMEVGPGLAMLVETVATRPAT